MGKEFSIEQLQTLMECVSTNGISELSYKNGETHLRIRGREEKVIQQIFANPAEGLGVICEQNPPAPPVHATAAAPAPVLETAPAPAAAPVVAAKCVTSPLVGTFYSASAPDKEPFVKVGQTVKEGDVVFIIESMKVMNEVPADKSGVVVDILVEDGAPVEFGQTILRLE